MSNRSSSDKGVVQAKSSIKCELDTNEARYSTATNLIKFCFFLSSDHLHFSRKLFILLIMFINYLF